MRIATAALLLAVTGCAAAGTTSYECSIKQSVSIAPDGTITDSEFSLYQGDFAVDRSTGIVIGASLDNGSYQHRTVIDYGSSESSFKAIWINKLSTGDSKALYLRIDAHVEGDAKPFALTTGNSILTGTCQ